jgi:hypothetical protein
LFSGADGENKRLTGEAESLLSIYMFLAKQLLLPIAYQVYLYMFLAKELLAKQLLLPIAYQVYLYMFLAKELLCLLHTEYIYLLLATVYIPKSFLCTKT